MTRFVAGEERSQSVPFPERLEDWISEENPVRVVDVFVDELDLRCHDAPVASRYPWFAVSG